MAGNHDLLFDHKFYEANWESWTKHKAQCGPGRAAALLTNATHYVEHEQVSFAAHNLKQDCVLTGAGVRV